MAYFSRSLLPAIIGHALGDALLLPAYVFHKPGFAWVALIARPVWETGNATTLPEKAILVFQAMDPSRMLEPGPARIFAVLAWTFLVGSVVAAVAFIPLARAARNTARDAS